QARHFHRTARAFQNLVGRDATALAQARELAEPELEDARHAGGIAARLDAAIELRQVAARPEVLLELVGLAARAVDDDPLAENDGPRGERSQRQQRKDGLYRNRRFGNELD